MLKNYCSLLIILLLLITAKNIQSQTFYKYGIKGGFSVSGLSTFNPQKPFTNNGTNLYVYDKSDFFNFFSLDIGAFAELFNSEEFCVSVSHGGCEAVRFAGGTAAAAQRAYKTDAGPGLRARIPVCTRWAGCLCGGGKLLPGGNAAKKDRKSVV